MPTLYRTTCNTYWKGRPEHYLEAIATGTIEELLTIQDQHTKKWQADDIKHEKRLAKESDEPPPDETTWERPGERWEMERQNDQTRMFAGKAEEDTWSMAYHII